MPPPSNYNYNAFSCFCRKRITSVVQPTLWHKFGKFFINILHSRLQKGKLSDRGNYSLFYAKGNITSSIWMSIEFSYQDTRFSWEEMWRVGLNKKSSNYWCTRWWRQNHGSTSESRWHTRWLDRISTYHFENKSQKWGSRARIWSWTWTGTSQCKTIHNTFLISELRNLASSCSQKATKELNNSQIERISLWKRVKLPILTTSPRQMK